jgi:hypothetical protein
MDISFIRSICVFIVNSGMEARREPLGKTVSLASCDLTEEPE